MMQIEVQETHPRKAGGRVAHVIATDGSRFDIWPDKLGGIQVGRCYDVEVEARDYQGRTIHKIVKATPVNGAAPRPANGNGVARPSGNGSTPAHGPASATEAAFVREVLCAFIAKGDVAYTKSALYDATMALRGLFGATLGGGGNAKGGSEHE